MGAPARPAPSAVVTRRRAAPTRREHLLHALAPVAGGAASSTNSHAYVPFVSHPSAASSKSRAFSAALSSARPSFPQVPVVGGEARAAGTPEPALTPRRSEAPARGIPLWSRVGMYGSQPQRFAGDSCTSRIIAQRLAQDGLAVAVNGLHGDGYAGQVVDAIPGGGGVADAFSADITNERQVADLVAAVTDRLCPIHVLVLNATGPQPEAPMTAVACDDHLAQLEYFVKSPTLLARAVLPAMQARRFGRIIQIDSEVVDRPPSGRLPASGRRGRRRLGRAHVGGAPRHHRQHRRARLHPRRAPRRCHRRDQGRLPRYRPGRPHGHARRYRPRRQLLRL